MSGPTREYRQGGVEVHYARLGHMIDSMPPCLQGRIRESYLFWQQASTSEVPLLEALRSRDSGSEREELRAQLARALEAPGGRGGAPKLVNIPNPHVAAFMRRYRLPKHYPLIAIIDPRTGELLWTHLGKMSGADMATRLGNWAATYR